MRAKTHGEALSRVNDEQHKTNDNDEMQTGITPIPAFIETVLKDSHAQDGADEKLLDILAKHIVHAQPLLISVNGALSEIDQLAESRVTKGDINGEPDHD